MNLNSRPDRHSQPYARERHTTVPTERFTDVIRDLVIGRCAPIRSPPPLPSRRCPLRPRVEPETAHSPAAPTSRPGIRRRERKRRYRQTPAGREAKRVAALLHKPWLHGTGPRTPAGKRRSALNARGHGLKSGEAVEYRRALADVMRLLWSRRQATGQV